MKYAYVFDGIVMELLPEIDPAFEGVPIQERYSEKFLQNCVVCGDSVSEGMIYDKETGVFSHPELPDASLPTIEERVVAIESELGAGTISEMEKTITALSAVVAELYEKSVETGE